MKAFQHLLAMAFVCVSLNHWVMDATQASEPKWVGDLAAAKKAAAEKDSDLFILLTGTGFCAHCNILKSEVLDKTEFTDWAASHFMLVKPEKHPDELLSLAVPTVVLAEPNGRPYGYLTGFASGTSVAKYRKLLEKRIQGREKRDAALKEASTLKGIDRAKAIDRALSAIKPWLGSFQERHGDPLLAFYAPEITEIKQLAGPEHALTRKYEQRKVDLEAKLSKNVELEKELSELFKKGEHDAILLLVEEKLKEDVDDETRFILELNRQIALQDKEQFEQALTHARRVLETGLTGRHRQAFQDREMFSLFRLDRIDEMLAHFDRRLEEAKNNVSVRRRLLLIRSSQMQQQNPASRNIKLDREFLREVEVDSFHWLSASGFLANSFKRDGQYKEALRVYEPIIGKEQGNGEDASALIESAGCQIELGELDAAKKLLTQAKKRLEILKAKTDRRSKMLVEFASSRMKEVTQRLSEASVVESKADTVTEPK